MKRTSTLRLAEPGKLTVYSDLAFKGDSHTFTESSNKINESPWKGKIVKSLIIQGNPWLFYPEEHQKVSTQ